MTKNKTWIRLGVQLLVLQGAVCAQLSETDKRADFQFLLDQWLPHHKVLSDEQALEVRAFLEASRDRAGELSDTDFALAVLHAASFANNGHDLAGFGLIGAMPRLPVRFWWFDDGLYVVKAHPSQEDLLGARVTAFGTRTPRQLLEDARPYLPGNEPWILHRSVEFLTQMPFLSALGSSRSPERVPLVFELPEGSTLRRVFESTYRSDPEDDSAQPWLSSMRRLPGQETSSTLWKHALDFSDERPAYLRRAENVWYEPLVDVNASYLRIASIRNANGPGSLHAALFDVIDRLEEDPPENLVIDLRYNTGGNFFNAIPFAFGVGVVLPREARIFVLVNRCTFSAAIVTLALIEHHAGTERVVIVGEPIGDRLRFWSEGGNVVLPSSKILVSYRDGLHDMVDGCDPAEGCWWGAEAFEHGVGDLDPELVIRESFEDYVSGRDLWLEAVRNELKR